MKPGGLIREARVRHGLDQRTLARRAGTTQAQVSRIERGANSPSIATLERLMAAMGEQLELTARPLPGSNSSTAELRRDFETLTPGERVEQAAELSRAQTTISAGRPRR